MPPRRVIYNIARNAPPATVTSQRWNFEYNMNDAAAPWHGCDMECMQCVHIKANGQQCSRNTCYTLPYCWQHLKLVANLRVGRTTLMDPNTHRRFTFRGLFACASPSAAPGSIVFRIRDPIVTYAGEMLTPAQLDARYPGVDETAPYVEAADNVNVPGGTEFVDSACMRGVGAYANDARNGSQCYQNGACQNNARLWSGGGIYPRLVALRSIRDGQEIFADYGAPYWGGDHLPYATRPSGVYNRLEYRC